jgi:hypothetical protein
MATDKTKPEFAEDQDMSDVSLEDVLEAKRRARTIAAYDALTKTPPMVSDDVRALVRGQRGYAKGGSVSSASKRADGCAERGKTKGTMVMCGGGMAKGKK